MASPGLSCAHLLTLEERYLLGHMTDQRLLDGVLWAAGLHHLASQLLYHYPSCRQSNGGHRGGAGGPGEDMVTPYMHMQGLGLMWWAHPLRLDQRMVAR